MRSLMIASAGLALTAAGAADAQDGLRRAPGASYGIPGSVSAQAPMVDPTRPGPLPARPAIVHAAPRAPAGQIGETRGSRWGSKIGGRWWAGANAPGGWAGYRRPHRGWAVPGYWNAPRFYVGDWSSYGLPQPPQGYRWARYYDDAVLLDTRGSVYDTVDGIDWDRGGGRGGPSGGHIGVFTNALPSDDRVYAGPDDRGYVGANHDLGYDQRGGPRRDNGLGGAAIGAVAGGVAGNVIAGRGNRLGGTLIGAGVGAAAGYAIDRNEDRGHRGPPPRDYGRGAGFPPPPVYASGYASGDGAGYASSGPAYAHGAGGTWVSPDGGTTVTTTSGSMYPAGSTTVVVQSAPMVTTTTTTDYYDTVSYAPRKVWRKRRRAKVACNCR